MTQKRASQTDCFLKAFCEIYTSMQLLLIYLGIKLGMQLQLYLGHIIRKNKIKHQFYLLLWARLVDPSFPTALIYSYYEDWENLNFLVIWNTVLSTVLLKKVLGVSMCTKQTIL